MKKAHYDKETKKLLGWYSTDIHKTIPTPNIEVMDTVWQDALNKNANYVDVDSKTLYVKSFTDEELLKKAKDAKKQELKLSFELEANKPVNGYVGGFDSAVKLDAAKRMLETAGATEVTFFDVDNKPNVLSISDATDVILAIGSKYQTDFAKYQGLKVQVDSKVKVSTVNSIVW